MPRGDAYHIWADFTVENIEEIRALPCVCTLEEGVCLPNYIRFDPRYSGDVAVTAVEDVLRGKQVE